MRVKLHWIFNCIVWEFSSPIEKIKVSRKPHLVVVLTKVFFIFPLDVSDLGLTESEYELIL